MARASRPSSAPPVHHAKRMPSAPPAPAAETSAPVVAGRAAIEYEPDKARGLDDSLKTLAAQPFGPWLLLVAAFGLLCFAAWSFLEAWQRRI